MSLEELNKKALKIHKESQGKIELGLKTKLDTNEDLSILYTPGVAQISKRIVENPKEIDIYTNRKNTVAIITDGSAVLGLGNIGSEAGLPVMEGKAVLFKKFGNVDAYPILLKTQNTEEIIETVVNISPTFAGINLEDICAPKCFEIETRLIEKLKIPVFHDDQHGTATVVLAALINALKVVGKKIETADIVINGAGAAGISIKKLLRKYGATHIHLLDSRGCIVPDRDDLSEEKAELAKNLEECIGLEDAVENADVFIGVSKPDLLNQELIKRMAKDPIIFAMANPIPEISYDDAKKFGAKVAATGRSDAPNQINNALIFPGLFRGALDAGITKITDEIKIAAAEALSSYIKNPTEEKIIAEVMDLEAHKTVAEAVKKFKNDKL